MVEENGNHYTHCSLYGNQCQQHVLIITEQDLNSDTRLGLDFETQQLADSDNQLHVCNSCRMQEEAVQEAPSYLSTYRTQYLCLVLGLKPAQETMQNNC